jgi:lysophospholipase L1-like esterase
MPGSPIGAVKVPFTPYAAWRAALQRARSNSGRAVIAWIGDSVAAGDWAGTPALAYQNQAKAASMPVVMASTFVSSGGFPAMGQSFFGDATNNGTAYGNYNNKVAIGSWSPTSNSPSLGGPMFKATAAATCAFTPGSSTSRTDIYTAQASGFGTLTINYDGGSTLATINENSTSAAIKTTVNGSLASHTINAVWSSGTTHLIGMDSYDSTASGVSVLNLAWSGTEPVDLNANTNGYDFANAMAVIPADLVIIHLGPNSWAGSTSPETFFSGYVTTIANAKTANGGNASVLCLGPFRSDPASTPTYTQNKYVAAVQQAAYQNGCAYYDLVTSIGDWTAANGAGKTANALHPNASGYSTMAASLYSLLINP